MELLKPKQKTSGASTQAYVHVEEIREGIIVLKSGALRAILLVSSLNFDLKSSTEQDAIIAQYQAFLNSLDFPVQIVVSSRRFDVAPYLEQLSDKEKEQENELLRFQISEYQHFIKALSEASNIMSKFFYVVVPFSPSEDQKNGLLGTLSGIFSPKAVKSDENLFESYRGQLFQRLDQVAAALSSTGVQATRLNTEEVIELLYDSYNPSLFAADDIKDVDDLELAS